MAIEKFLSLLATHLRNVADNIEAGNSDMSEEEAVSLLENIRRVTDREEIMSSNHFFCIRVDYFDFLRSVLFLFFP